ncbi:MAG: hypothetical protein M3N53_04495 [Actinomycetota bacterium]|nr:hypothetical protein [Actinomycetota bacterium]
MRLLPVLLLGAALLTLVMLMAGDRRKGLQAIGKISFTIAAMLVLVAIFAVIADQ